MFINHRLFQSRFTLLFRFYIMLVQSSVISQNDLPVIVYEKGHPKRTDQTIRCIIIIFF